jgi:molybdate transport system regulatory protein
MSRSKRQIASISIEIHWPNGCALGPGDLPLIDMIGKEKSIIGAGRALGVSYRKCWLTVDMLNRCFDSPVVATFPGRRNWGAEITPFGERLIALYRSIEGHAGVQSKKSLEELSACLNWEFDPKARIEHPERALM